MSPLGLSGAPPRSAHEPCISTNGRSVCKPLLAKDTVTMTYLEFILKTYLTYVLRPG